MVKWRFLILVIAWPLFYSPHTFAGAWVMPKGTSKWAISTEYTVATHLYDDQGRLLPLGNYTIIRDALFGEYGLTDTLTLFEQLSFEQRNAKYPLLSTYTGLGYSELGARYALWEGYGFVTSFQTSAHIPGAMDEKNPVEWGHTDFQADIRGMIGYSFTLLKRHVFTDVQAAYRARFGDPADELRIDTTVGVTLSRRWMAMIQSFHTLSIGSPKGMFAAVEDHKIQASALWDINSRWALQGGTRATIRGKNALHEQTIFGGVWLRF